MQEVVVIEHIQPRDIVNNMASQIKVDLYTTELSLRIISLCYMTIIFYDDARLGFFFLISMWDLDNGNLSEE